jgi:chromosome segregation ATPase
MMYLISLQPLTPAPFRLVDEINQAMDPVNERRIWEQVVSASSDDTSPQYFLITPKLLPDLTYSETISVHVVFNGYYNINQKEWDTSSALVTGSS